MFKKYVAFILAILMIGGLLCACAPTDDNVGSDTVGDTAGDTDGAVTPPEEDKRTVYTLIVSNELTGTEKETVNELAKKLSKEYGIRVDFRLAVNNNLNKDNPNEILLGRGVRAGSASAEAAVDNGEFIIVRDSTDGRIYVVGKTSKLSIMGLEYLFETYFDSAKSAFTLTDSFYEVFDMSFPLSSVSFNGVKIEDYQIVVPSASDLCSYYTALNIADYFNANMGVSIPVVMNGSAEKDNEILIGDTDRDEDDTALTFGEGEYMLVKKGSKIVMRGYEVYVGAAAGYIISEYLSGDAMGKKIDITDLPTTESKMKYVEPTSAKNVILMIGDGMGFNHVNVALNAGLESFVAQHFTSKGKIITQSQSVINGDAAYTDSAAAATAIATGYKTINGYIGKDANKNNIQNVRELADAYGAKTAVVTTDDITGATPSGFLAHNISRNNTSELQTEINALIENNLVEYCEGGVDDEITVHTRNALKTIAYTDAPFFIMVEEARIDKRSHDKNLTSAIDKVQWYNDAITYVACFTMVNRDTVLIVTADHETGGLTEDPNATYGYKYTTSNHTNADVPVYALGCGTDIFNNTSTDNTVIAKFIAKHFGAETFGQAA